MTVNLTPMLRTKLQLAIYAWGRERGDSFPLVRFAHAVGINKARVSEYASGKYAMSAAHLMQIAYELNMDPADLVGWDDDDPAHPTPPPPRRGRRRPDDEWRQGLDPT
jgi:transcriptional regulator with XRE-family HTH domain